MIRWITRLLTDEDGASTAEYALILTLIVIILITTLSQLGQALDEKLLEIIGEIQGARGGN